MSIGSTGNGSLTSRNEGEEHLRLVSQCGLQCA